MTPRPLDVATVQAKLRLMRDLLDDLAAAGRVDVPRLLEDRLLLRAVERILTQLVDLAAAVNTHVVSSAQGKAPSGYRASFLDAASVGALPRALADELLPSVGMRNVLVHDYAAVNLGLVADALPLAAEQYGAYVRSLAGWLAEQPPA